MDYMYSARSIFQLGTAPVYCVFIRLIFAYTSMRVEPARDPGNATLQSDAKAVAKVFQLRSDRCPTPGSSQLVRSAESVDPICQRTSSRAGFRTGYSCADQNQNRGQAKMGQMNRAIAREEDDRRKQDRFASTIVIAASIIAAVRLARDDISRPSPRVASVVADSVSLARMILAKVVH